jgi:hypothetical protein
MKILYLHGWHSQVGGVKPSSLQQAGHEVAQPQLDDDDFDLAVRAAQAAYNATTPDVIVGSSRGGAVAMNLCSRETPLVLLCPAWKRWGTVDRLKSNAVILHSRNDDVIPFAESELLVSRSGLEQETLIEVGHDHRLADTTSLAVMAWACEVLGSGRSLPWMQANDSEPALAGNMPSNTTSQEEACYVCDSCGENIVIPLDLSEGASQTYVEDCPVCCRANTIHVHIDDEDAIHVWAEPEQDHE